jgi:arginyl-tRNA synthetase
VKADDLLDNLVRRAEEEVRMRNSDLPGQTLSEVSQAIAVGALRYYMLRFTRNKVIAFDFADALSFDGETGPYVQYAVVRSAGILGKVAAALGVRGDELRRWAADAQLDFLEADTKSEEWELLSLMGRHQMMVEQAVAGLEFSSLAKYAFVLAQKFNGFYHRNPVLQETDPNLQRGRVLVTYLFRRQMTALLDRMGIPVPSLM